MPRHIGPHLAGRSRVAVWPTRRPDPSPDRGRARPRPGRTAEGVVMRALVFHGASHDEPAATHNFVRGNSWQPMWPIRSSIQLATAHSPRQTTARPPGRGTRFSPRVRVSRSAWRAGLAVLELTGRGCELISPGRRGRRGPRGGRAIRVNGRATLQCSRGAAHVNEFPGVRPSSPGSPCGPRRSCRESVAAYPSLRCALTRWRSGSSTPSCPCPCPGRLAGVTAQPGRPGDRLWTPRPGLG